ncbi:MAG TPA: SDR family oxidoreductase [Myxococcota bacterium]|nr:SDR family oxidoreductase [Myxococcota bacterium]
MSSRIFRDDLLAGQVCLVTGGGTGIGAACARELGRLGATVVIASRKAEHVGPAAEGLTAELGRPVYGEVLDIRDREACDALARALVERFGRVDVLVNNGGGQFMSPAEMIRGKGFDAVIATNLTGTWNLTRAVADAWMLGHGGRVVNITMLTRRGFPGMAHSVASRAGVEAMTRTLAVEWASRGILLNCVEPGLIASSGIRNYPDGVGMMTELQRTVPLKRLGSVDEIAWLVAFLAGPAGAYVTGQTWVVDGGKELWGDGWPIPDPDVMPPVVVPVEPWETP